MKKAMLCMALAVCMVFMLVGCNSSVGYTFTVDTGDEIKIQLDTTDGYSFDASSPFVISCEDGVLSQGLFIAASDYHEYKELVSDTATVAATVLENGEKDGHEYIMWKFDDGESQEWNYAVLVTENTAVLVGNNISEETARACFDRLTFSVED